MTQRVNGGRQTTVDEICFGAPERIQRLRSVTFEAVAAWKTVPRGCPCMIGSIASSFLLLQIAMRQPAALTIRAAVSLVAMPPVPHCVPFVDVSTARLAMSCTS